MARLSPLVSVLLPSFVILATATSSAAQPAPQPPARQGAAAQPTPAGAPGAAGAQGQAAPAQAPLAPPRIDVNDPLLTPVTPAPRTLTHWRDALKIISTRSVDLALAQLEIERAEGLSRQALAAALPSINATGSATYYLYPSRTEPVIPGGPAPANPALNAQISASVPILAPRAWYGIKTAEISAKSVKLSVEDRRRVILAQVATTIVEVYTSERIAEINRVGLRSALERLDLAQRKARLGDGTRLDVLRAEQDSSVARSTLITGDESLRKSREALGLALGSSEGYSVPPTISLNELEQALHSSCNTGPIDQRPDILQGRTDLELAQRQLTDVKLAFAPTAVLSTTLSTSNQSGLGQPSSSWIIQGVLSIPIWDGGARYGALRIARANVDQVKLRLDATLRNANVEVTQSLRAVAVAEQSRQVAQQNRDLAREAARLAQRAFEAGAGTSFDLVDTGQRERQAELNLAVEEFGVIQAKIAALLAASACSY